MSMEEVIKAIEFERSYPLVVKKGLTKVFNDIIDYYMDSHKTLIEAGNHFASELVIRGNNQNDISLRYKTFVLEFVLESDSIVVNTKKLGQLDVTTRKVSQIQGEIVDKIHYKYGQPESETTKSLFELKDEADIYLEFFADFIYDNL